MGIELVDPMDWDSITEQIDIEFVEGTTKALLGDRAPVKIAKEKSIIFYAIPMDWMTRLTEVSEELDFQFIGKEIGTLEKGRFRLGLQVLSELAKITHSFIIVSQQAAEAFTYGRSIIRESVLELNPSLVRGQRVLVLNKNRECLGMASLSVDAAKLLRLGGNRLVAKNLVDIGWFLRRLG